MEKDRMLLVRLRREGYFFCSPNSAVRDISDATKWPVSELGTATAVAKIVAGAVRMCELSDSGLWKLLDGNLEELQSDGVKNMNLGCKQSACIPLDFDPELAFKRNLSNLKELFGMDWSDIGRACDVSPLDASLWMDGKVPSFASLLRLAKLFRTTVDYLLRAH